MLDSELQAVFNRSTLQITQFTTQFRPHLFRQPSWDNKCKSFFTVSNHWWLSNHAGVAQSLCDNLEEK